MRCRNVIRFLLWGILPMPILCVTFLSFSRASHGDPIAPRRKKLIASGWDKPTPERLHQNLAEMEKRPFDGVVISVPGQAADGGDVQLANAFSNQEWKREGFQKAVNDLKACQFKRFTDNFVIIGVNPGNVDWFDDDAWCNIVEHWRIAAWIAREGRCKGILFDPEHYTKPFLPFRYGSQPQSGAHSFDEYYEKARQRGREVMRAVTTEYPNITLFTYFMNQVNSLSMGQSNARLSLATSDYGLYVPFINGWLDAAPPTATFVDGYEGSYLFNSSLEFLQGLATIKSESLDLVAPENRAEYRAQVQAGFGIYLDAYVNPPTATFHIDLNSAKAAERLETNVATALRLSDEYVWIYGEQFRWWPTSDSSVKAQSWPKALPGIEAALLWARDPSSAASTRVASLQAVGTVKNIARNGDFSAGADAAAAPANAAAAPAAGAADWDSKGAPAGWTTWQQDDSKGSFSWDANAGATAKGAARAAGILSGCFIQNYDVKPGEHYAIAASYRRQGHGSAWLRVRWQTAEGKWIDNEALDRLIYSDPPGSKQIASNAGWQELFGAARVPEGAGKLVVLLSVADQPSARDVAWFDDVRIVPLQ